MAALAPSLSVAASNVTTSMSSPEKRIQLLQQLIDLQKSGTLTYDEFANEKAKILSN
jgi:hypothetical protein